MLPSCTYPGSAKQRFGAGSGNRRKQHLTDLCFGKSAVVTPRTTDRYRRSVARVACEGTDASSEQVHAGMAWVFDRYVTDRGLYAVQDEARGAGRGLWSDREAVAPWSGAPQGPPGKQFAIQRRKWKVGRLQDAMRHTLIQLDRRDTCCTPSHYCARR